MRCSFPAVVRLLTIASVLVLVSVLLPVGACGEEPEPSVLSPVERSAASVVAVEARGPGPDLVRRGSGFVRDVGVVVAPLAAVREADAIELRYASLETESVATRVLAIDHAHGLVLLAADTAKHAVEPLPLHAKAPVSSAILIAVSRAPSGVVHVRPMTVSDVRDVPGLGPSILFESPLERAQDGAVLLTPGGRVAGVMRVHEVDEDVFGCGVPAAAIARMRADSVWTTPALPGDDPERQRAAQARLRGLRALLDADCGVAVAHLRTSLDLEPKHPGAGTTWWQIGTCLEELGRAGEAAEAYRGAENALRREGAFAVPEAGTVREIRVWRAITRVQSESSDAWRALWELYDAEGNAAAALEALRHLASIETEDVAVQYDLGDRWTRVGKPKEAVQVLERVVALDPEFHDAWLLLGLAYEDQSDATSALRAYGEAARTKPDDAIAHRGIGWAHAELGQWAKAWQAFEKAHALAPADAPTLYDLAVCYHRLGFDEQLAAAQKKLLTLDPDLAAKLIDLLGDRTAPPIQVYEFGPKFPTERIREYWAKPYRITSLAYGDGEWGVVLTRQAKPLPQKYRSDAKIAKATWNGFRKEGYALTALARRAEQWVSTWTKDAGIKSQSLIVVAGFPESDLRTRLAKGLRITSIARGKTMWGVVMSYPSPYSEQIWLRGATVPAEAIQARWKEGYRITAAAYGEGRWAVILSKGSGLGEQDWVLSSTFPEKDVRERWKDGYEITTLSRGGGQWLAVLSTVASGD